MIKRPIVTLVTTTYYPNTTEGAQRRVIAGRVVKSWEAHLRYAGHIALHIADDGTEKERKFRWPLLTSHSRQERHGVGASLNAGFRCAFKDSPLAMYIVDDWMLGGELDITPWVDLLMDSFNVGMVRLGPPHPHLSGSVFPYPQGWGLILNRHHYAYAMRPALYHKRFFDAYGSFKEDESAVECERQYNNVFCASDPSQPGIVYALPYPWIHEGELELGEATPKELEMVA